MISLRDFILENTETSNEVNGFAILKPEFLSHKEDWLNMLKNNGWQIVQTKQFKMNDKMAKELYKMHKDKDFYNDLCKYMSSDECVCCSCHKNCKDPIKEMTELKERVRKSWGKSEMKNAMHGSDSLENVYRESHLVFNLPIVNEY